MHNKLDELNKNLVSIIVPIYNVETYIAKCVESLLSLIPQHLSKKII